VLDEYQAEPAGLSDGGFDESEAHTRQGRDFAYGKLAAALARDFLSDDGENGSFPSTKSTR
jgi:hypothetical protein